MSPTPDGGRRGAQPPTLLLDRDRTTQSNGCPDPVGIFVLNSDESKLSPIPCSKWTCKVCGPRKVKRLRARAHYGHFHPRSFITLTLHTDDPVKIMAAWNRFAASLRVGGWSFRYMLVKEWTRKGKRHLHVMAEGWLPYTKLSGLWRKATGGMSHRTHARGLYGMKSVLGYVTKYLSKGLGHKLFDKGERRYSASLGVLAPVPPPTGLWRAEIMPRNGTISASPALKALHDKYRAMTLTARVLAKEDARWFPKGIWPDLTML